MARLSHLLFQRITFKRISNFYMIQYIHFHYCSNFNSTVYHINFCFDLNSVRSIQFFVVRTLSEKAQQQTLDSLTSWRQAINFLWCHLCACGIINVPHQFCLYQTSVLEVSFVYMFFYVISIPNSRAVFDVHVIVPKLYILRSQASEQ